MPQAAREDNTVDTYVFFPTPMTLTFKSGDPNFSRPRIVKLGGDRIMLLGFTNLGERAKNRACMHIGSEMLKRQKGKASYHQTR